MRLLGEGPRMVVLHGGPGLDHHVLLPLARPLARSFEVWLPDLPGHGASAPERPPSLWELFDRTARWLRNLQGGFAYLVGHSFGAWLARELVRRNVIAPKALVLLNPPARLESSGLPPRQGELRAQLIADVEAETGEPAIAEFNEVLALADLRDPQRYEQLLRDFVPLLRKPPPACKAPCATLVIGGTLDRITPPSHAASIAAATKGAEVRLLRYGHHPYASDPAGAAAEIERFIRSLK